MESQIQYFSVDWVTIVVWPFEVPLTVVETSDSKYGSNPVDGVVVESSDRGKLNNLWDLSSQSKPFFKAASVTGVCKIW